MARIAKIWVTQLCLRNFSIKQDSDKLKEYLFENEKNWYAMFYCK